MSLRALFHTGFSRPLVNNFRPFLQKSRFTQPSRVNWVALGLIGSGLFSVAKCDPVCGAEYWSEQRSARAKPIAEQPLVCLHATSEIMRILQENSVRPFSNISQLLSAHTLTLQQCSNNLVKTEEWETL